MGGKLLTYIIKPLRLIGIRLSTGMKQSVSSCTLGGSVSVVRHPVTDLVSESKYNMCSGCWSVGKCACQAVFMAWLELHRPAGNQVVKLASSHATHIHI